MTPVSPPEIGAHKSFEVQIDLPEGEIIDCLKGVFGEYHEPAYSF